MKKFVLATALSMSLAVPAFAETVEATITDHYKIVVSQKPYNVEVCRDVTVGGGTNTEGAIIGGIIGGVIGNQFGKGSGKEAATGVGALIGAIQGGKNNGPARTQTQCQIETRYNESQNEVYSHSIMTFYSNGKHHRIRFNK